MASTPPLLTSAVRDVISGFAQRCKISYERATCPPDMYQACYDDVERRLANATGVPPTQETMNGLRSWIVVGSTMGMAYQHLPTQEEIVFVCTYTALLVCSDDIFQKDVEALATFNTRFINNQSHEHPILDAVSALIREIPSLWEPALANMAITSTLNFMTSLLLEDKIQDLQITIDAPNFAHFSRIMSGIGEAFSIFIFPKHISYQKYAQAMPDLMDFLSNTNDIMSFYKEELAGEEVNMISIFAASHGLSKIQALQRVADDTAEAHGRITRLLALHSNTYEAWTRFQPGYIGFHAGLARYKLHELGL